jgi:hypothetical protein
MQMNVAAVGRLMSWPKKSFKADHRYMAQITSSAIGNQPPVEGVVKALTAAAKTTKLDEVRLRQSPTPKQHVQGCRTSAAEPCMLAAVCRRLGRPWSMCLE